ncbi:MAG TPA: serine hydrolase [Pyrinomonadaceae bacterium]|jgi:CubicO group peptidase (beta-lactamase class C family)|nr:serine hydrolase [Pyrinomonadaceae bacterium]
MKKKLRHLRRSVLLCVICALCFIACPAQDVVTKVDDFLKSTVEKSHFSGAILIAREGRVLVREGYGMANVEHDVPAMPETKFRIGSLTKQFTAAAILMLQERGKLQTQDAICKHLPECLAAWQQITIHQLLTHTSGIPNVDHTVEARAPMSLAYTLQTFKEQPLEFTPGARFQYSNTNYLLLGYIIESISGRPYDRFLDENIFRPLKMSNTGYDNQEHILKQRAAGYSLRSDQLVNASYVDMSVPFAAGGLYSTVDDLYRWEQSLATETLLSKKSIAAMFTPYKGGYGYGWYVGEQYGRKSLSHGGWISGFAASVARYPDDNLTIIVLSNLDNVPVNTIARHLAGIIFGVKDARLKERKVASVDPRIFDGYVGQYELTPTFLITITKEGDRLMGQATGFPKIELLPASDIEFFVKEFDAQILFVEDGKGTVTHSTLTLNGREARAKKIQ